jgi:hypothetical protein
MRFSARAAECSWRQNAHPRPSYGLQEIETSWVRSHPVTMAYTDTGPRISRRAGRGDRERSLGLAGLESVEAETSPQAPGSQRSPTTFLRRIARL